MGKIIIVALLFIVANGAKAQDTSKKKLPIVLYIIKADPVIKADSGTNKAYDNNAYKPPPPQFPGGVDKFMLYIKNNYKMPPNVEGIKGRIVVRFVVETDGSLTAIKIVHGLSPDLDKEAIRVLSEGPKWLPGVQNGKPVKANYAVPIPIPVNY